MIGYGGFSFVTFAFVCSFADAKNWSNAVADGSGDFFTDVFIAFMKNIATFGMTDYSIIDRTAQLRNPYFASKSAEVAPIEVLGGEFELTAVDLKGKWLDRDERRC